MPVPPRTESELLERAESIAGLELHELASRRGWPVPGSSRAAKGWAGQLLEEALGATAASLPEPDFQLIGVELKTIPIDATGRPMESTYVCTVPVDGQSSPRFAHSTVWRKLSRVLWVPISAPRGLPVGERRIGSALLWTPSETQEQRLCADWEELMDMVLLGELEQIMAHHGTCLQIRPKAADSHARRWGVGETGDPVRTLPRGFYLRASFTAEILRSGYIV